MNKGNFPLFSSWLKQFTSTVFIQSFHAIFLMFTILMLSGLQKNTGIAKIDGILAVVAIACAMALIKFEKMIKKLLGIEDSPIGHTAGAGAKMFMGAKSAIDLGKTATGGFKKSRDANKNLKDIQDKRKRKEDLYNRLTNPEEYYRQNPNKRPQNAAAAQAESMYNNATTAAAQGGAAQGGAGQGNPSNKKDFHRMLEEERMKEEIDDLKGQEMKAQKAQRASGIDKYLNAAGTLASMSVGLGAGEDWATASMVANVINQPLDRITDKFSNGVAGREIYKETKEKYIKENDSIKDYNQKNGTNIPLKYVDEEGNRNEVERASKALEKSISSSIKEGFSDYTSNITKATPIKMTVDQVTKFQINHEVKSNKKDMEKLRELQKIQRENGSVEDL